MFRAGQEPPGPSDCSTGTAVAWAGHNSHQKAGRGTWRESWRRRCLVGGSVPLSAPDLAASTRWKHSHGNQPEATDPFCRQWQPPFMGRDRAARIRGHRELCLCVIQQLDIPDWRWHWVDCQKLCGRGDVIWEIVFLPADIFGLAVKNVSCPQGSF